MGHSGPSPPESALIGAGESALQGQPLGVQRVPRSLAPARFPHKTTAPLKAGPAPAPGQTPTVSSVSLRVSKLRRQDCPSEAEGGLAGRRLPPPTRAECHALTSARPALRAAPAGRLRELGASRMACLEIRRQSTHSRVMVIYRYRRGPGLASRVSPQPVLPAIVRSSPRAWAAALCHSHGGESAPRSPTPKRLCTRPWPSLVSGQLGHLLRVGGATHRHRRGQARPGPRALAASSEGVSQPGHPTVRDIRLLTAECLWRTSRGQAQEAGLAVSVSGKVHFKTIQEKKKTHR